MPARSRGTSPPRRRSQQTRPTRKGSAAARLACINDGAPAWAKQITRRAPVDTAGHRGHNNRDARADAVNVLLLSMPDSFEHMAPVAIRMPNGALTSLAGNVDPHHSVAVADLILVQNRVAETVERLVREREPDVVGLSVMTFQRRTAFKLIAFVRALRPSARIVVGGYDPSLAPEAWAAEPAVDFIVRGEGEATFAELLRAVEAA